jgi:hypothetical protein
MEINHPKVERKSNKKKVNPITMENTCRFPRSRNDSKEVTHPTFAMP